MDIRIHSQVKEREHKEREHFFTQAKVVAAITLLSRIFGFFRDMGITTLGANRLTDAFGMAFQIPNLFRRLFGEGALTSSFVPVFTEVGEKDGFKKASDLLSNAFGWLAVFLAALLIIGEICFFLLYLIPGPQGRELLAVLGIIMLPYMFTVCLLALCSAALNCRGHFAYPAFAPIIFNIFGIIAAWFIAPLLKNALPHQLMIVAFSVIIAGIVQLVAVVWLLKKSGFELRPRLKPVEPGIRPIVTMLAPMLLPLGFLQLSEFLQKVIAWNLTATKGAEYFTFLGHIITYPLTPGVITRVQAAQNFYQFPMGVLAISLGVAVFPLLSRYAARNDMVNLRDAVNRALRLSLMEGMATGVGLFILAEPIMMIYARRKFTVADAMQAAFVLKMYVLGMWAYCSYQILLRAFYASKDTTTPLKISCVLAVFNLTLLFALVWIPGMGPGAFGLSTALTFSINAIVLVYLLRRRLGLLGGRKIAISIARSAVACALMAAVVYPLKWYMRDMNNLLILAVCIPVGAAVFTGIAWLLRAPELAELRGPGKLPEEDQAQEIPQQ